MRTANIDWANRLSTIEIKSIQKGVEDIKSGNVFSHTDAMSKINLHFKDKEK